MKKIALLSMLFLALRLFGDPAQTGPDQEPLPCPDAFRIDPAYLQNADDTGGQVLMVKPSETAKAMSLIDSKLHGNTETILRTSGKLRGNQVELSVPVDYSVQSITFSTFIQCLKSVSVVNPKGAPVSSSPEVTENRFHTGVILTVKTPDPGEWRIRLAGSGIYSAMAEAKSEIRLLSAEFVDEGGRPGHEGYFKHEGPLTSGQPQTLQVELDGPTATVQFVMITSDGDMNLLKLSKVSEDADSHEYAGQITIPAQPFRIVAEGFDSQGLVFRRFYPPLFRPQ
jgi:hypothetical protein